MSRHEASFRDPSGFVFRKDGKLFRQINPIYFDTYNQLKKSGLFDDLFRQKLLIPHSQTEASAEKIILEPEVIPFISYPYEWSFLQYKHAALLTLKVQKACLEKGFSLKDATAFNVTFHNGRVVFIDTLSPEIYTEGHPWRAYGQFISHFFGPMLLAHYYGLEFLKTLQSDIDGIPLDRLSKLLPWRSRLNPIIAANVHLPAKYQKKHFGKMADDKKSALAKNAQLKLIDSLYQFLTDLKVKDATEWDDYYRQLNYSDTSIEIKKKLVSLWGRNFADGKVLDLGGNDGTFSRLLPESAFVITADIDPNAVAQNYRKCLSDKTLNLLPLVADFLNPAPGTGFNNRERESLMDRLMDFRLDGCLALAVIHHISLSGNIPFEMSAGMFAAIAPELLIEFPDRDDSWVQFLLKGKRDFEGHFDWYAQPQFESAYLERFNLVERTKIEGTSRWLYHFKRKV